MSMPKHDVLVVEDTQNIAMMVAFCLEDAGCTVRIADDGIDGLAEMTKAPPDIVLLDLRLPRMNGFLVLETMRQDATLRSIPVMILSARADDRDIERARQLGANEYLVKPFGPDELLAAVERTLAIKEEQHDADSGR